MTKEELIQKANMLKTKGYSTAEISKIVERSIRWCTKHTKDTKKGLSKDDKLVLELREQGYSIKDISIMAKISMFRCNMMLKGIPATGKINKVKPDYNKEFEDLAIKMREMALVISKYAKH